MKQRLICTIALGLLACSGNPATNTSVTTTEQATASSSAQLNALLDEIWALNMRTYPTWATYEGIRDHDGRLGDLSDEAREAYVAAIEELAQRAEAIDSSTLSPLERDTQRMVLLQAGQLRAGLVCKSHWWDVNGLGGPQVDYPMLPVFFSVRNEKDLENLKARYEATAAQIEQTIAHLREGVQNGYAPTKTNVERALTQLDEYLESPLDTDPMLILKDGDGKPVEAPAELRGTVRDVVRVSLADYREVLRTVVLPAARPDQGIADLPTGKECYAARMQRHIGPGYTADELHERGLAELEVLRAGMVEVGAELGLKDASATDVIRHFATTKSYYATSEKELVDNNAAVVERARESMPRAFGRLPKTPVEMRPIEAHRAASAPAAYYYSAPEDGSRPAYYYVNTADPTTRPLFNLEALAFHEAIPGHHQQIALAKELPDVHIWRRNSGQTAFVEGWALYAEVLADELGLYSDPVTRFGMYNYQAWRAARLVIDTGLHHKGWSRAKAIAFLNENTALPMGEIENEIDRYIAWPGQALAYMVGRMKIQELRATSRATLGDAFSLKAFHDAVNAGGAVPLTILEVNLDNWTETMSKQTDELPDFRSVWDFNDPVATRKEFLQLLDSAPVKSHPSYRAQLLTQIARTHSLTGEFDEAHRQLDEVQKDLGSSEPVVEVRYLLERGRTFNSAKEKASARPLFLKAWEMASRAKLDGLAVDAAHMMAIVESGAGALEWNERAMAFAEASDAPAAKRWLGALYNNLGWTHHDAKRYDQALAMFEKGLAWRAERDDAEATRIAKWSVGRAMRSLGRVDDALKLQHELEAEREAAGQPGGFVFEELGELYLAKGEKPKAKAYFAKAYPLLSKFDWVEKDRLDRIKTLGEL